MLMLQENLLKKTTSLFSTNETKHELEKSYFSEIQFEKSTLPLTISIKLQFIRFFILELGFFGPITKSISIKLKFIGFLILEPRFFRAITNFCGEGETQKGKLKRKYEKGQIERRM